MQDVHGSQTTEKNRTSKMQTHRVAQEWREKRRGGFPFSFCAFELKTTPRLCAHVAIITHYANIIYRSRRGSFGRSSFVSDPVLCCFRLACAYKNGNRYRCIIFITYSYNVIILLYILYLISLLFPFFTFIFFSPFLFFPLLPYGI